MSTIEDSLAIDPRAAPLLKAESGLFSCGGNKFTKSLPSAFILGGTLKSLFLVTISVAERW